MPRRQVLPSYARCVLTIPIGTTFFYLPEGDRGAIAQQWNSLRLEIVKTAVEHHLLTAFRSYFQAKLLADAKECAIRQ